MEAPKVKAEISTVASFPKGSFLENLVVRSDNSLLLSSLKARELSYVLPAKPGTEAKPELLLEFDQAPMSFVETEPDIFYLSTSDAYATRASSLYRLDMRQWHPGGELHPIRVLSFPPEVRALNGSCLIGPRTILVADSASNLIWRLDLSEDGYSAHASVWLKHYSMLYHPGEMKPEQPGVNGLRFSKKTSYLYYTATVLRLFMRVPVDAGTLTPLRTPEYLGGGKMMDDFCIDGEAEIAYVTTHRNNTIACMSLKIGAASEVFSVVAYPFDDRLVGSIKRGLEPYPG